MNSMPRITQYIRVRANRAFTLIEILIVVVILSIMIAISYPSVSKLYEATKRNSVAMEFIGLCRYARTQAIVKQHDINVFVDLKKHEYWCDLREDLDPKQDPSKKSIIRGSSKYSNKRKGNNMEQRHTLDKGVSIAEVSSAKSQVFDKSIVSIDFYADGSATAAVVVFQTDKNGVTNQIAVEILRPSGVAQIVTKPKEEENE